MASRRVEDFMSDEIITNSCSVCATKGQKREADKYCVDCEHYYCSKCVDVHKGIPAMEKHQILGKSKGVLPSYPTLRCWLHPTKAINRFCEKHDEVVCSSCVTLNHSSCNNVHSIPDKIDSLYKKMKTGNIQKNFQMLKPTFKRFQKLKEDEVKSLKKSLDSAVKDVRNFRRELDNLLDKAEMETIELLNDKFNDQESSIMAQVNEMKELVQSLDKMSEEVQQGHGNKAQQFVATKSYQQVLKREEQLKNSESPASRQGISFVADQCIKTFLEQIKDFERATSLIPKCSLYTVQHKTEIHVKLPDDSKDCDIVGSCLTDDCLLLTDWNNRKLKRVCLHTGKVRDHISLESWPRSVCLVDTTQAAVSLPLINTVQFVCVGEQLQLQHRLTFDHPCGGLAHWDSKLYITDYNTVYIYDMKGREIRRISTHTSGRDIFSCTRHIAVSAAGDQLYIADRDNGLITLDIAGNHLSTLSSTDIQVSGAHGVCTDGRNVFVCGLNSDNVVQIGPDNTVLGQIAQVRSPRSLCFAPDSTRLYVTSYQSNTVTVLELV